VSAGRGGEFQNISSSDNSSGLTYVAGASSSPVSGSTNLIKTLFLSLSTLPSLSFFGVKP
jgi:hypothetical protein